MGRPHSQPVLSRLECCPGCDSDLVQPVEWYAVGAGRWQVQLRCPDCELRTNLVYDQGSVERYDEIMDQASDALQEDLVRFERENLAGEIVAFCEALERDLLLPEDF